jgi:hypothetical protein
MKIGKYRHYKGKEYEVVGVATNSETLEELVVYKALYNIEGKGEDSLWVRPRAMFEEQVEVNGVFVKRFEYID